MAPRPDASAKSEADEVTAAAAASDELTQVSCGVTQWEQLADAILATPVPRFIENPPVNNNGTTDGILEI